MNRIVHLALKVEDLEKTTKFYEEVFGFWEAETRKTRDHLSRHLTDGEIDFTAAYVEIESTYLVPAGSALKLADEVDRKGVRIIVPAKAAYELYLTRTIKSAELVAEPGADASFKRFVEEKFDALAGLKPRLISDQAKLPGSVIVQGCFTAVQQAAGVPKGRSNAAKYLAAFIEDVKATGLVAKAIADNKVVGLSIAAAA